MGPGPERVQSWIDEKLRSREHPKGQRRIILARFDLLVEIIPGCKSVEEKLVFRT